MKTKFMLAAAALLSAGVALPALTAPAFAAKKEEVKGPQMSAEFIKAAKPAQDAINAKDWATAETQLAAAEAVAKSDDEKYTVAQFRYTLEQNKLVVQQQANPNAPVDETKLYGPMQALLASPKTPADAKGKLAYRLGALSFNGKKYPEAVQYLNQATQLGYKDENIPLMLAQARIEGGDTAGGLADLDRLMQQSSAGGQKAPENYYKYAFSKANQKKMRPEAVSWLARYASAYPTKQTWRAVILNYGLQPGAIAQPTLDERLDLFRLLRTTGSLADQALYEEYAQATRDKGLPAETLAVLQEGVSSGKLQGGSAGVKAALAQASTSAKAEGSLAGLETKARAGANGKLASQTGDAYLSQGNWAKAADLYKIALTKGAVDADAVNTHLGIALARSGDKAGAQAAFGQVKGQNRAEIAQLWTAYVNQAAA